jgi:lysophospholipase L1-like esterase
MAASYGFRASFFWEPTLFKKTHRTPYEEDRAASLAYSRASTLAVYEGVRRDWAPRNRDEFTYLGDLFAETPGPRFIDHTHPGETATREIAAAIGRQLLAQGRLRRRNPPP